jgi:hypothetical protein
VHRNETRDGSARTIQQGKRCICDRCLAFESMCEHEHAMHGKFVKGLFAERMFQPCQIERRDQVAIDDSASNGQAVGGDSNATGDLANFSQDGEDDGVATTKNNDDDDEGSSSSDDVVLADLVRQKRPTSKCDDEGGRRKTGEKQRLLPVPRGKMSQIAGTLVDLAGQKNLHPEMSHTVTASMLDLQDMVRGQNFDADVTDVTDRAKMTLQTAEEATQSSQGQCNQGTVPKPRQEWLAV